MASEKGVALITGAAGGLGRGIALRLAQDGYDIALNDLPHADIASVEREVKKIGRRTHIVPADVTVEQEVADMIKSTVDTLGSLDVMIANAGIVIVDTVLTLSTERMKQILDVNVLGVFHCYKYAGKQMVAQGKGGRVIGASSLAGKKGFDFLAGYVTSKFAVRGLTQAAAAELGKHGITVNAYAPGLVETNMITIMDEALGPALNGGSVRDITKASAVPRIGEAEDIANLVSYLCSPGASYVTGQSISIDGGHYFD